MNDKPIKLIFISFTNQIGPNTWILHITYSDDTHWFEYWDQQEVIKDMLAHIENRIDKATADRCRAALKYNLGHDTTITVWP